LTGPRLTSEFWVQSCVRRADREGIAIAILRRGDPVAGSILIRIDRRELGCTVLTQTRDADGNAAWLSGTGTEPVTSEAADAYIERHRARDPDLWVVEIDDRQGRLPFDDRILP
jgi:GMP synthase (glutamine-hydrolysing)